jgi:Fe-S-cluster-containing hydrogenase components 1
MKKQAYIVIDVALCEDCNNCFMACKDEHVGNCWLPYTDEQPRHGHKWMDIRQKERGQYPRIDVCYLPTPCQHCEKPACMEAYPDCISRREDGIVLIDPVKAKGNKDLVNHCPYHAIFWNEELQVPQKCTMCAHILDNGEAPCMPRCVHSCPTDAMQFYMMTPEEMALKAEQEHLETLHPEIGAKPHIYYKNLYRFQKLFIAGGIIKNGECEENAEVVLNGNGISVSQTTDGFGDFKFDRLEPGEYSIEVNGKQVKTVQITESVNVGSIVID